MSCHVQPCGGDGYVQIYVSVTRDSATPVDGWWQMSGLRVPVTRHSQKNRGRSAV